MDEQPKDGDLPLQMFFLKLDGKPGEFPVTVRQMPTGWKVDWEAYVEFHDGEFGKFLVSSAAGPRSSRVILERTSYGGVDREEMNNYLSYKVESPNQVESPDPKHSTFAFRPGPEKHHTSACR